MRRLLFPLFIFLASCGYRVDGLDPITISVPYVIGDHEGELTDALAFALSKTANFRYVESGGDWTLYAKVVDDRNDRIGYRYDRKLVEQKSSGDQKPEEGKIFKEILLDNVIGIENRKNLTVEVKVVKNSTGQLVLGPQKVKSSVAYDYDDPNSLVDLSFVNPDSGTRITSIDFSLGQLDAVAAAGEDAIYPIYRMLAQRIVDGMIAVGDFDVE